MPKPYRRRKGKTGPYVGNYRVTFDGRDINLKTKDASEALARARLVKAGKWPPIEAAVEAARAALDPGAPPSDPEPPEPAGDPGETGGAGPHDAAHRASTHPAPPRETLSHDEPPEETPDLNTAAQAAAEEASGRETFDRETQAAQENGVNQELAAVMAELGGGESGADLLDGVCDGAAAFLLWAEGKALELGINWTLARRKSKQRLKTKPVEQGALMRKALKVGLKGVAVVHFPDFATRLTPGWAIAIGMVGGAGQMLMGGAFVDRSTGQALSVAEAFAQAQEDAKKGEPPPPPATPAA